MTPSNTLKVRHSIADLQNQYEQGDKLPLENLMRAWKGIKELPPDNPKSFFSLAGYHGEPFRGAGWGIGANYYWGGYCNHGNVLFPTWHRVYLLKLEEALQSIEGCEEVTMPYWDQTDAFSIRYGIPWALTNRDFVLDGVTIPNPLRSFVFPEGISDSVPTDNNLYTKPKNYETVRYPLAGLVGNEEGRKQTEEHNSNFPDYERNVDFLNFNVTGWLRSGIQIDGKLIKTGVVEKYKRCLEAPNYTVFSNTSSAQQWNMDIWARTGQNPQTPVVALESPHNSIHLAVGGFNIPGQGNFSQIPGANGDMGENNTASFDPIFYFHHCNIDRVFWLWQKKHGATDKLELIDFYPGTNSSDNQGSTPGIAPNTWLTLESPLNPFKKNVEGKERLYTSLDCINIETQLGYTYSKGSLEELVEAEGFKDSHDMGSLRTIRVSGVNRASIKGSFVISAFANINGERHFVGAEAVLSRWNVNQCANCQTHLEVKAFCDLPFVPEKSADGGTTERLNLMSNIVENLTVDNIDIEIQTRELEKTGLLPGTTGLRTLMAERTDAHLVEQKRFRIDIQ